MFIWDNSEKDALIYKKQILEEALRQRKQEKEQLESEQNKLTDEKREKEKEIDDDKSFWQSIGNGLFNVVHPFICVYLFEVYGVLSVVYYAILNLLVVGGCVTVKILKDPLHKLRLKKEIKEIDLKLEELNEELKKKCMKINSYQELHNLLNNIITMISIDANQKRILEHIINNMISEIIEKEEKSRCENEPKIKIRGDYFNRRNKENKI